MIQLIVFLLSFFITLVESIHLRGDFVKAFTHLMSERPNLSLQLLPQEHPQSLYFVLRHWHAPLSITPPGLVQQNRVDKKVTNVRIFLRFGRRPDLIMKFD